MNRLRSLIIESLQTPKKKDCNCGCGGCSTVNLGPILNENKAFINPLSTDLQYHIDNNRPLTEHLYRAGSDSYFALFAEARNLYSRNVLKISNTDDLEILKETDLGHFGMFEGKKVPLDFPMVNEEQEDYVVVDKRNFKPLMMNHRDGYYEKWSTEEKAQADAGELNRAYQKTYGAVEGPHIVMYKSDYYSEKRKQGELTEKKKAKKKGPKLNKPMRSSSGGKAYKVYVKDPKTGNVKTVRFGSGGLRAKINDRKARQAFAKRHKCSTRNDKTKASYWSCRLPRYAKLLGLKSSFSGFW